MNEKTREGVIKALKHWRATKKGGRFHWAEFKHFGGWLKTPTYKCACGMWIVSKQRLIADDPGDKACPKCKAARDRGAA